MAKLSRRQFLLTAAGGAAGAIWLSACGGGNQGGSQAAADLPEAERPEVKGAVLGFIALTDASPLIIAKEKGFFSKYGMPDVQVVKQTSWAATRDNIELGGRQGGIDGAHILSPMPLQLTAGSITKTGQPLPMYTLARLNVNGQGISTAEKFLDDELTISSSERLQAAVARTNAGGSLYKGAMTFPGGTHDLWLRYWLAGNGINPNTEADLVVVPPPQMVANMQTGNMDVFCVGEPWNERLVNQKLGYTVATTGELWLNHPEKAFSMRADWVDAHPKATQALLKAVQEAQIWCDDPANLDELCEITSRNQYFRAPVEDIKPRLAGRINYGDNRGIVEDRAYTMVFWDRNASFPFKSHDQWFVLENMRWGYLPANTDVQALVNKVNRADLWREAAAAIGQEGAIPASDSRGKETFFDGTVYDPENPQGYLNSLKFKAMS